MSPQSASKQLPMGLGYFRLFLRHFGGKPEQRAAILEGTDVDEAQLADAAADITVFQQVRQIDNLTALLGRVGHFSRLTFSAPLPTAPLASLRSPLRMRRRR